MDRMGRRGFLGGLVALVVAPRVAAAKPLVLADPFAGLARTTYPQLLRPVLFQGTYQIGWISRQDLRASFTLGDVAQRVEDAQVSLAKHIDQTYARPRVPRRRRFLRFLRGWK